MNQITAMDKSMITNIYALPSECSSTSRPNNSVGVCLLLRSVLNRGCVDARRHSAQVPKHSPLFRLVELTRARSPVWLIGSRPLGRLEARNTRPGIGTLGNDVVPPPLDVDLLPL